MIVCSCREDEMGIRGGINLVVYDWESRAFVPASAGPELEAKVTDWLASDVISADENALNVGTDVGDELDDMQAFARDIVAIERSVGEPLSLILTGTAGTGKTRTVRSFVRVRRKRKLGGNFTSKHRRETVILATPTGCAAFNLRLGATTVHRTYGVKPVAYPHLTLPTIYSP